MGCNPRLFHPHLCWRVRLHGPLDTPFIPQPLLDSNRSSSLTIRDRFRKHPSYHHATHDFAAVYALQGNAHLAVKWLRETVETGMPNYILFSRDSNFDSIRK